MARYLPTILTLTILISHVSVFAFDFYGATVTEKAVPSSAWSAGIVDLKRPTVGPVSPGSPAANKGLKTGNIILSVNGQDLRKSSELGKVSAETVSIMVFDGLRRKKITFDRSDLTAKPVAVRTADINPAPTPRTSTGEPAKELPPLVFTDARDKYIPYHAPGEEYDRKFGKEVYGGKPLEEWRHQFGTACYELNEKHWEIEEWSAKRFDDLPSSRAVRKRQYGEMVDKLNDMIQSAKDAGIPPNFIVDLLTLDHRVENLRL